MIPRSRVPVAIVAQRQGAVLLLITSSHEGRWVKQHSFAPANFPSGLISLCWTDLRDFRPASRSVIAHEAPDGSQPPAVRESYALGYIVEMPKREPPKMERVDLSKPEPVRSEAFRKRTVEFPGI